jgi:glycosyltransferase involved in cell wall biosynthesis
VVYLKGKGELSKDLSEAGSFVDSSLVNKNFFSKTFELFLLLRKEPVIVHAHLPEAELASAIAKGSNKLIVSRHNSEPFYPKIRLASKVLSRFVEMRANRCVAISNAVMQYLIDSREWKDLSSLTVVYYGIECSKRNLNKVQFFSSHINYLSISRLVEQKSIPTLLRAFKIHSETFPNDTLTIVGDGNSAESYKRLARHLGLIDNLKWIGRVANVDKFYKSSDVFILASKYEGFGLVLLEAMCEQIAILASNVSSIPEVLGADHKGLFQAGSESNLAKLMKLARDLEFRKAIISQQDTRIEQFSPKIMESKIYSQYLFLNQADQLQISDPN